MIKKCSESIDVCADELVQELLSIELETREELGWIIDAGVKDVCVGFDASED